MVKVKVLKAFEDYQEKTFRVPEDVFECTEERAKEIEERLEYFGKGPWIEIQEEPKKPARKTTTTTKGKA